jgi:Flp pilus assembly protein TadD
MRFGSISLALLLQLLLGTPLARADQPVAHANEPFTYMMPQILWPKPRGPEGPTCPTCSGVEMKGIDPARLFDTGSPAPAAKPTAKVAVKPHKRHKIVHSSRPAVKVATKPTVPHKPILKATAHKSAPAVVAGGPPPSPCPKVTADVQKMMDQGRADDAERYLKSVLVEHPDDKCIRKIFVQLSLWRAYNFMKCGNIECAARRIREALFVDPSNTTARYMLDRCYLDSGVDPSDTKALSAFANGLLSQKRYVAAFVDYEHLTAVDPQAINYIGYARAAQQLGQDQLAVASYSEALKMDPLNASAWRELGLLCDKLGDQRLAESALSQSMAINPNDAVTSNALIALTQRQLDQRPDDPAIHLKLAHIHMLEGDYAGADDEYSKAELIRGDGDESIKQLIRADRAAAESEHDRAPQIQQAIAAAAKQAAVNEFETKGPSPMRKDFTPQPDVAYSCSCN